MIDVAAHISGLLYERETVTIPGLGTLKCTYQEAIIDHVQGMLYPPSMALVLDEQLITDDETLVKQVAEVHNISLTEAQLQVDEFVFKILNALEKREIIVIPKVGRMYRDYEGKLQFLQDNTNFNKDSFGLPEVQFYPILRNKVRSAEAPVPLDKRVELPKDKWYDGLRIRLQPSMAAMLSVGLLLFAFTIYLAKTYQIEENPVQKLPVSDTHLNKKPTDQYASVFDGLFGGNKEAEKTTNPVLPKEEPEEDADEEEFYTELDTEASTLAPNHKECVIIIGAFSKKEGVQKRIKDIYEMGFDAYQDEYKGLMRVGAQFSFEHDEKVREVLKLMRSRFDTRAYVLEM